MDELYSGPGTRAPRASGKSEELNIGEFFRLLLRHKFLLITLVISALGAALVEHATFPSFQVRTQLFIQGMDNNPLQAITAKLSGMGIGGGGGYEGREFPEKYLLHVRSFEFYQQAARKFRASEDFKWVDKRLFVNKSKLRVLKEKILGSVEVDEADLTDDGIAERLLQWVTFGRNGQDSISVQVNTPSKKTTLLLANFMADVAAQAINDHELKELNDAEKFVQDQIAEAEKDISDTDAAIVEFKQKHKLLSIDTANGDSVARAIELKKELESVRIEYEQNEKVIQATLVQLREQGSEGATKYGLARKLTELRRENNVLGIRQLTLKKVLDELVKSQDPHTEQRIFDLRKKMELQYALFQELKQQLFQIEIQRIVVKNRVRSLDKARDFEVRRSVSLPRKLLIAVVIALLIGGPTAYAWELVMPTVKSRSDLEEANLIFLGSIPDLARPGHKKKKVYFMKRDTDMPLMVRFDIDSPGSMALKHIRTRILHLSEATQNRIQVLSLLSPTMGEGKSFVSRNLAACMAHMKKRVLIIDCDLRKGTTSEFFRARHLPGLSDILTSTELFGSVVKREVIPNLDLLAAGTHHHGTTEIMASARLAELMKDLRSVYDFIILDTPPLIPPPDAALISKHADMHVMLATYNRTSRENLDQAIDNLLDLNNKRVYAVLNRVEGMEEYTYVAPQSAGLRRSTDNRNKVL